MIYYSELFDYIEYETTQQGVEVVSTETDERYFIEKSKTDEQIRKLKPEVIAEMVDIIPNILVKKCEICGREFYSQTARQNVCSHDCFLERARRTSRKATREKNETKKEAEDKYLKEWRKESKNTTAECSVKRTETIWMNYEYDAQVTFSQKGCNDDKL